MLPFLALAVIAQVAQPGDMLSLYGPLGLTVALVATVGILWRDHQKNDERRETDLVYWRDLAVTGTELADKATTVAARKR